MITCANEYCIRWARKEYAGLCPRCWLRLSEEKRATLVRNLSPQVPDIHEHHYHQHINPPQSRVITLAVGIFGGVLGGAVIPAAARMLFGWLGW